MYIEDNHASLASLMTCLELSNCKPNQDKVVILQWFHFRGALVGWVMGENIWTRSTILALDDLGYTYLYTRDWSETAATYRMLPTLVAAIFMDSEEIHKCLDEPYCVKTSDNPYGIPVWKMFDFMFWAIHNHPLGKQWTINPEPYGLSAAWQGGATYFGFSIEPSCNTVPFVPHSERAKRRTAFIMSKYMRFFSPGKDTAWEVDDFDYAAEETGIRYISGAKADPANDPPGPMAIPKNLENLGYLNQQEFLQTLAQSTILIGVGMPKTSPTPYEALCLGVPFINPILHWDHNNPEDREGWDSMHGTLKLLDPPYVYNVKRGDRKGFAKAIKSAIENPIDRFVLDRMTLFNVEERMKEFFAKDWKAEAKNVIAESKLLRPLPQSNIVL
ncbi:uncharacterized protein EI90DRAFT_46056 [Cantharellus anzutake]|uniref:uncharacterized protein n=1 Tax=Cantharellus anzutake TaxID=1750568 RepID=UPI001904BE48|nr:uncharacterized protein EI90DRAFT_46056 [Cantharellus anzutake]KAF8344118.1 hypothetical protein EI90DRAFT_46056 [Cantharellus anzutake]